MLVETWHWAVQHDDVWLAVAREVHELRATSQGYIGFLGDGCEFTKLRADQFPAVWQLARDRAEVGFVKPSARLFREDPWNALTVQVGPAIRSAIQPNGEVFET